MWFLWFVSFSLSLKCSQSVVDARCDASGLWLWASSFAVMDGLSNRDQDHL